MNSSGPTALAILRHYRIRLRQYVARRFSVKSRTEEVRRLVARFSSSFDPARSGIPYKVLKNVQQAVVNRMSYRGRRLLKNPFDLALYMTLLERLRPELIVEIGSSHGGSALWLRDLARSIGFPTEVWSYDINMSKTLDLVEDGVYFERGDIFNLESSNLPILLSRFANRRILVIEDGPHSESGCAAALKFFHPYLKENDYIVIEDGNCRDLGLFEFGNGPNRAIRAFLRDHPDEYVVDREYTDFWGPNYTWNTDGYLRRVSDSAQKDEPRAI